VQDRNVITVDSVIGIVSAVLTGAIGYLYLYLQGGQHAVQCGGGTIGY